MSNARFSIIQAMAVRDERITPAQFRTLSALGIYGDENGWCFPNLKTLGDDLGKSKQAVSKDIQSLVELGYVQVKHQYRDDGSQRGNLYRLIFDDDGGQRDVDGGQLNTVDGGSTPEVDGGQLNTVDGGSTPEVDAITSHCNVPCNDPIENNIAWLKISELYNFEPSGAFGLLSPYQQESILPLLKKDGEKCVKIAVYYRNLDYPFTKMVGGILNNFDTWRDDKKDNKKGMRIA